MLLMIAKRPPPSPYKQTGKATILISRPYTLSPNALSRLVLSPWASDLVVAHQDPITTYWVNRMLFGYFD